MTTAPISLFADTRHSAKARGSEPVAVESHLPERAVVTLPSRTPQRTNPPKAGRKDIPPMNVFRPNTYPVFRSPEPIEVPATEMRKARR